MYESIYAKLKLKEMCSVHNIKACNAFIKSKVIIVIKCTHGVNPHEVRMSMINNNEYGNECPRCSEVEMQEDVIKCRK